MANIDSEVVIERFVPGKTKIKAAGGALTQGSKVKGTEKGFKTGTAEESKASPKEKSSSPYWKRQSILVKMGRAIAEGRTADAEEIAKQLI